MAPMAGSLLVPPSPLHLSLLLGAVQLITGKATTPHGTTLTPHRGAAAEARFPHAESTGAKRRLPRPRARTSFPPPALGAPRPLWRSHPAPPRGPGAI